ncbi:hypothetical protein JCM10450v2_006357 [Rhodotorula kratochvilovae]
MALVSPSPPPPSSHYPAPPPLFARASSDSHAAVRALPGPASPPPHSFASSAASMNAPYSAAAGPAGASSGAGAHANLGAQGAPPSSPTGAPAVRPLPSPQSARARTVSAPFADGEGSASAATAGVAGSAPPALVPSRSSSTPPAPSPSASSRPSPAPTPPPGGGGGARGSSSSSSLRSTSHAHSASSSSATSISSSFAPPAVPSLPRLSPVHYGGAPSPSLQHSPQTYLPSPAQQQPHHPHQHHMAQVAAHPHPTFAGQPFPPFAPAYPHPAYPFIPSPHPGGPNGMPLPGYAHTMQLSAEQQKRMQHYQHQWQMEMLKGQQQAQNDSQRRRTTSGPAASSSPSYYTTPQNYPPSPSATHLHQQHSQLPFGMTGPSLPPGAMLPHVNMHGYPTPPGSTEGANRSGGESGSSSGGSGAGRAEAYHPYRRDDRRGDGRSTPASSSAPQHRATPSNASSGGRRTPSHHGRGDSSASIAQLAQQSYTQQHQHPHTHALPPPIRTGSSSSVSSLGDGPASPAGSARGVPLPGAGSSSSSLRQRTDSQTSSSSSSLRHARGDSSSSSLSAQHPRPPQGPSRGASFDSARSATPVQARARPSPLGAPVHHAEEESDDDGAESDGTAEATATIGSGLVAAAALPPPVGTPNGKGKEKEKKGMKSRFKKAFGVSSSASANTLTEAELDGRGPKVVENGGARLRRDSSGSSGDDDASTMAAWPYATHQAQQPSVASSSASVFTTTDGMSTMTGTTAGGKKPPSSRFRLLNNKFNGSSDNLSISSTVSSASVMIRKLGQMGKLARRNSLMGLTKAFKKDKGDASDAATVDGVLTTSGGGASKLSKKDKKKAGVASASVSHATAEVDSPSASFAVPPGMSPAAALARKQQQAYAEQEAAEQRARDAAAAEAARLGPPSRSFEQVPAHARSESAASDATSVRSGKERKKGQKWRLGFGGGSKTDLHEQDDRASVVTAATERAGSAFGHYDDATPRQSIEVLAPPQSGYQTYGASYAEREAGRASSEYEPSLYREGATPKGIVNRPVRGILKGAGSYRQEDFAAPRPPFARNRASSFDAPQQHGRPGSPGGAALVNVIPSEQQVDGVGPSTTSPRADTHPPTSAELMHDAAAARVHPETGASGPYAHPGLNASAPALNQFSSSPAAGMRPSPPATAKGRRIAFASNLSVHTTWPAAIYDRRAEPATCNRLTPLLAQQIKEELNSFKMEEMDVHPASRKLTHFFV